jgi:hypothetical protein
MKFGTAVAVAISGTVALALTTPATAEAATKPKLAVTAPAGVHVAGAVVHLTGTASSVLRGRTVDLQRLAGPHWRKLGSTAVHGNSYAFNVRLLAAGASIYRVVFHSTTTAIASAASPRLVVHVDAWHFLADIGPVGFDGDLQTSSVAINGTTYPHSLKVGANIPAGTSRGSDYNLSRKCVLFEAVMGPDDNSDVGFQMEMDVIGDATSLTAPVVSFGAPDSAKIDVTGVLRLRLQTTSVAGSYSYDNEVGWGNARVLCSF